MKTTAIAGATVALEGLPALAESNHAAFDPSVQTGTAAATPAFTRGLGIYPGAPTEDFSPKLVPAGSNYRNLALLRPAFQSSSYDFNLTAQLVTDGIRETRMPEWIRVSDSARGLLPRQLRETVLDHATMHPLELLGDKVSVEVELCGGESAPEVDRVQIYLVSPKQSAAGELRFRVLVSEDGREWKQIAEAGAPEAASTAAYPPDFAPAGHFFTPSIPLGTICRSRYYRVECALEGRAEAQGGDGGETGWTLTQVAFYRGSQRVEIGGPYSFTSAWMPAGMDEEWVYVDLGSQCEFDHVGLHWIARAAEGAVQVSEDARAWSEIASLAGRTGTVDNIALAQPVKGRYVRILMTRPATADGYILSEVEVLGRGGLIAEAKPPLLPAEDGSLRLAGGPWRVQRASLVSEGGEKLSQPGHADSEWVAATVPGTVLASYYNAGAVADPNYGENQLAISDSFFHSDFWYRTEFVAPQLNPQQTAWLEFAGINWKAEIYLNGEKLGRVEGGFQRGQFEVSGKLLPGRRNALAVRIEKNATPGSAKEKTLESVGRNGGALGADNPTYHASIGWDWIPTIRGRNTGIWGEVTLAVKGAVTLENPFVSTALPLPDTSTADVSVEVELVNHQARPFAGLLRGRYGEAHFEQRIALAPLERKTLKLNPATHPALRLAHPQLWWPAGYGEPALYDVELTVEAHGKTLDKTSFRSGVRQMSYSEEGGALRLWINGRRFIARGGNWGFGESMLRYRAREYDAAVRYHREMNFTMIRNWVGQIGDDAFYEACDRHGIVVWQDFWLANPWDGPEPADNKLFLDNARDFVLRIRNHASIGLYCGRNEGFPPPPLEQGIRKALADLHPGMHYIPSSADDVVSGHGPYQAKSPEFYFNAADKRLHSEIGAPNIPPIESVRLMMPEEAVWPQSLSWGLHDFCLEGAQGGEGFRTIVDQGYGGAHNAEEWLRLAQFVNYDTYRAMFEAQSKHRMGVFLWMSHPCWPSFVWQTYDYYFEPTAAYFGCKKGSEPLHIQWNCATESIEVVNYSAGTVKGLTARVELLNLDGSLVQRKSADVDSKEDSTVACMQMSYPAGLTAVHILRLTLAHGTEVLSTNFYLRPALKGDYRAIRQLPKPNVQARTTVERKGDRWLLVTELHNQASWPALMVRIKAVREKSGDRILPAIYSDNYVSLMPGESQTLTTEVSDSDTRGERPTVVVAI